MAYQNIPVDEFEEMFGNDDHSFLLDVRTPEEVADGVIEEVADGTLDRPLTLNFFAKDFEQQLKQLDQAPAYYVYCRSGKRSAQACALMERLGFEQVYNIDGGYLAWKAQQSKNSSH